MFNRTIFWGIKIWQVAALLAFYAFFATQHWLVRWLNSGKRYNSFQAILIDYFVVKIVLTLPLWWLYFKKWQHKAIQFKLIMHSVTAPIWVCGWFYGYRMMQDLMGGGYLTGDAIWWDLYIPGLFYCLQFAVFHVYAFYQETILQKQREQQLMQAAYNSEINALKAQIRPHFLFNTLNSISASVLVEMEHTRELIAILADNLRYSLKASENESMTFHDELQFIQNTLDLEKERWKERLQVVYKIDESLLQNKVPPMLLQPLTENAVKHGIAKMVDGGTIHISTRKSVKKIRIGASDTGAGIDETFKINMFKKGIGLKKAHTRLMKLLNEPIQYRQQLVVGIEFYFYIPINTIK